MLNKRFCTFEVKTERESPLAKTPTFQHFEVDYYLTDNTVTTVIMRLSDFMYILCFFILDKIVEVYNIYR